MTSLKKCIILSLFWVGLLFLSACTSHEVEVKPLEIKPIHITIDINIKVDRALDDFFGDLDKAQAE
jgi:hypothetical protein